MRSASTLSSSSAAMTPRTASSSRCSAVSMPVPPASMSLCSAASAAPRQAPAEMVAEQRVIAIPGGAVVDGADEQVVRLEPVEHVARVGAAGDGVAQRGREALEDGGGEQELEHGGRHLRQHVLGEV